MWVQLVLSETAEQYRLFAMLRPCLDEPVTFSSQGPWLAMLEPERRSLVDSYFTFDARVMRELVGKRPTSKLRRQLDSHADRLNVTVASCRRQFDNLQRLYEFDWEEAAALAAAAAALAATATAAAAAGGPSGSASGSGTRRSRSPSTTPSEPPAGSLAAKFELEGGKAGGASEAREGGSARGETSAAGAAGGSLESQAVGPVGRLGAEPGLVKQTSAAFLLSHTLSSKYVRLLFLANHQFDASKRRLQMLAYSDWDAFAASLLLHWASPQSGFDLDTKMVKSLRAIKAVLSDQRASAVLGWPLMQQVRR